MRTLVVGNGGREHALCWKLAQSPLLTELLCAPGNPGIAECATCVEVSSSDIEGLVDLVRERSIDLTVVGPELPLTMGLVDRLRAEGSLAFGPVEAAARLEGSKVFAKEFMARHEIPTARFDVVGDADMARKAVHEFGFPVVLKADGLAAGKGVIIPTDEDELEEALALFFEQRRFGDSSDRVVIEECLTGEEVSMIAISDGRRLLPFATSKDYKRIGERDEGPNTGGMGAHSPAMVLASEAEREVVDIALTRAVDGMREEGVEFAGVLYAGLMITPRGPRVLEYNVRFGDPECQPLMMRLSGDLLPVLAAGAAGDFGANEVTFERGAAACIVLASAGYPGTPATGDAIEGLERASSHADVQVFQAGTNSLDGRIVTAGGRVLNVCARGEDLREALSRAYRAADDISWANKVVRRDIGRRVVAAY